METVAGVRRAINWGWRRLSPRWQDRIIDAAAYARAAVVWAWFSFLMLVTVKVDPANRARRPIPVRVGRSRVPAEIILTAAGADRDLRLLACFWRHHPEQTAQALCALTRGPVDVSGVIVFPQIADAPRALPLAFRVLVDPVGKTATLTHARASASASSETVCEHPLGPLVMNSAVLAEVLAPLLGRRVCPSLIPKQE